MGNNLIQTLYEQQNIIEQQSRLIVDLAATLEEWESAAGYDGAGLKARALDLQGRKGRVYGNEGYGIYQYGNAGSGD